MIILKSQNLILRPLQETDLDGFATYRSDPEVARFQSWSTPYTLNQAKNLLKLMKNFPAGTPGNWYQLAIERQNEPGIIGDCVFKILASDHRQARIGFTFSQLFQKKGYATEAVTCLLNYLFIELDLHRVTAICDTENIASIKLLERVGMRREGHFLENVWFKDTWGSEYSYAILRKEWA